PAIALVAIEHRIELAVEVAEAAEERDRRRGLEGLGDGRANHLLVVGLVDPERLAVADDRLPIGWIVVPAHPVGLFERDRAMGLERAGERGGLDGLREHGLECPRAVVALLERAVCCGRRAGGSDPARRERQQDGTAPTHRVPGYLTGRPLASGRGGRPGRVDISPGGHTLGTMANYRLIALDDTVVFPHM